MKVHNIIHNIKMKFFECRACDFIAPQDDLTAVAKHVVENQYPVVK